MIDEWYVVIDGKPKGPFTTEALKELDIKSSTFLKRTGWDDYKEANEVPELRALFGIKREIVLPEYYGSMDYRLLAVMIDYVIVAVAASLPALLFMVLIGDRLTMILIAILYFLALPVVKVFYGAVMESSAKQGTYGKYLLGLAVVNERGERLSNGEAWTRNFAKIFSFLPLGIGYVAGFFDKRQRTFHDRIAGTMVIKLRLV